MSILRNLVIVMGASIVCTSAPAALVNLGDGTVKDEASNLIWLKDWDQLGADTWFNQSAAVDALAFAGSSDWRLPTIDEYLALWAQVGSTTAGLQSHFDDVQPTSINDIRLFHWSSPRPPLASLACTSRSEGASTRSRSSSACDRHSMAVWIVRMPPPSAWPATTSPCPSRRRLPWPSLPWPRRACCV